MRYDDNGKPESLSSRFLKLIKEIEISGGIDVEGAKIDAKATVNPSEWGSGKQGQFKLLGMIHDVASRLSDTISNRYYILIDDLDVDWHNEPIQNEIFAAMFSSLRKVCRPPHIKCVVSIQDRIFRELPIEHKDKFRDSLCNVDWDADVIREMIDKRIRHVIDIPAPKIWDGLFPQNGFAKLWGRIGGKPREAIRYASLCIETARKNSHYSVEESDMNQAYKKFSGEKIEDISSELDYVYPSFISLLTQFNGMPKEFALSKIKDVVDSCILKSMDSSNGKLGWIRGYENSHHEIARILLQNGILLFKRSRTDPPQPFIEADHDIYSDSAFVAFHPMYVAGLGLT